MVERFSGAQPPRIEPPSYLSWTPVPATGPSLHSCSPDLSMPQLYLLPARQICRHGWTQNMGKLMDLNDTTDESSPERYCTTGLVGSALVLSYWHTASPPTSTDLNQRQMRADNQHTEGRPAKGFGSGGKNHSKISHTDRSFLQKQRSPFVWSWSPEERQSH